jgi:formiminotetrahydrofolate cyclodeaminase
MADQSDYEQLPLKRFLSDIAAAQPTPGGGAVAAATGALAAATGQMAANYTIGKKKYADVQEQATAICKRLAKSQGMLTQLIAEDMIAYRHLQASWKLDAEKPDTADEKAAAIGAAIAVPFEILTIAEAILDDLNKLKDTCNPYLLSDVGVAAELAWASARAAALNVRINLPQITDSEEAASLRRQLDKQLTGAEGHFQAIDEAMTQQI